MRVVIVGAGDVGSYLAQQLSLKGEDVVVIDTDPKALEKIEETTDVLSMHGNGTYRKVLEAVKVATADLVVGVTSTDEVNLVITSLAAKMGAKRSLARVDAPEFYLTSGGIERNVLGTYAIVCASRLVSSELLRLVRQIDCAFIENFSSNSLTIAMVKVGPGFRFMEKPGSDIELGKDGRLIGIVRHKEVRRPAEIPHLYEGDLILLAGRPEKIPVILRRLSQNFAGKKAVIIGGGDVGFQLASSLSSSESRLTVIDIDRRRCEFLSEQLDHATIVHGDGTSLALLQDEHVEVADYLLSVTKADEVNLMSSLVAQEIGVPSSYTLVHRPGYSHVYEHLGVKGTASAHELMAATVQKYMPKQTVLTNVDLPESDSVVVELQLPEQFKKGKIQCRDLSFPSRVFLVGISRSEEFIFVGPDDDIYPSDVLIVISPQKEVRTLSSDVNKMGV